MRVKYLTQILHHTGPEVDGAAGGSILDSLDSLRDLAKDPKLLSTKGKFGTLEIIHLEIKVPD